jgi:hypothetical protein
LRTIKAESISHIAIYVNAVFREKPELGAYVSDGDLGMEAMPRRSLPRRFSYDLSLKNTKTHDGITSSQKN